MIEIEIKVIRNWKIIEIEIIRNHENLINVSFEILCQINARRLKTEAIAMFSQTGTFSNIVKL